MITRRLLAFSAVALLTLAAWSPLTTAQGGGSISLTALDTPYAQDFDTLALTGTSSVVPAGWLFSESGTNANATYTAGTGSGNAGDTYSFGAASSPERAFGGLQSGSLVPTVGALFTNNTGETITSLEIAYTGEHWRLGTADRVDRIDVEYSQDATSLTTGLWVPAPALAFSSPTTAGPAGARDGNLPGNQAPVAATDHRARDPARQHVRDPLDRRQRHRRRRRARGGRLHADPAWRRRRHGVDRRRFRHRRQYRNDDGDVHGLGLDGCARRRHVQHRHRGQRRHRAGDGRRRLRRAR